eukprot:CAMPEP_0172842726 /NCGR_PEP_ID=MMETSP1075-20121228/30941_1 /TAXON_ID=2916 /ORGANISM="Ceratium fusus, Strain PA161109" /LENGTH=53 /DNA_ID=CAMNT_0013686893 /DNA_START=56 /DNA_END=214 /DNA_ORIENTATION=-
MSSIAPAAGVLADLALNDAEKQAQATDTERVVTGTHTHMIAVQLELLKSSIEE